MKRIIFLILVMAVCCDGFSQGKFVVKAGGGTTSSFPSAQISTTATAVTIFNQIASIAWLVVNPPSTIGSLTITLPANPLDGQVVSISFGGTIASGDVVGTLTVSPNASQQVLAGGNLGNAQVGDIVSWRWLASNYKWYRIN